MVQTLWRIAYSAGMGFFTNRLSTSAAAMAYYTMFALVPILIFAIAIAEPFVGRAIAQETIFGGLSSVLSPDQLKGIRRFASQDLFKGSGLAAIVGAIVLVYSGRACSSSSTTASMPSGATAAERCIRCWQPFSLACWRC